jgi:hypothetical protein
LWGGTNIVVEIDSTDDANTVCSKTVYAINSYQFSTPNLSDMILRGVNGGEFGIIGQTVVDKSLRFGLTNVANSLGYGTYQYSDNRDHGHLIDVYAGGSLLRLGTTQYDAGTDTPAYSYQVGPASNPLVAYPQGGSESRPVNYGVLFAIRY